MDKNTIIAIVLSALVIIVGFSIQSYFYPPLPQAEMEGSSSASPEPQSVPLQELSVLDNEDASAAEDDSAEEELFVIETNRVKVTLTNRGGDILSYLIKEDNGQTIEMADYATKNNRAFSVIFGDATGAPVSRIFNVRRISDTSIGFYAEFKTKGGAGGKESSFILAKQYTFYPDNYMFELAISVDGGEGFRGLDFGGSAYTLAGSPQIGPQWDSTRDRYDYRRFQYMEGGKQRRVTLSDGQTRDIEADFQWAAVASKYFTLIAVPEFPLHKARYSTIARGGAQNAAKFYLTRPAFDGASNTDIWHIYAGPRTERELAAYNHADRNPFALSGLNLNQVVESSGILAPIELVLKWIMEIFHKIIPNWGVSIILMTILMRLIIFPLTRKSSESTLKMQAVQPRMQEIQTKYADNPQKMNEEMAKLYKETGYNPMSGCLPLLIQFPLIFAMYNLFNNYFEFRGAMFIPGWISDLSKGDSICELPFSIPLGIGNQLRLLPIIYVVSQLIFGKVTQPKSAGAQASTMKFMMYGMPLIFFFIFYNAPSGLLLYWICSNLLTLAQQVIINKMLHGKKDEQQQGGANSVKFPVAKKGNAAKKDEGKGAKPASSKGAPKKNK